MAAGGSDCLRAPARAKTSARSADSSDLISSFLTMGSLEGSGPDYRFTASTYKAAGQLESKKCCEVALRIEHEDAGDFRVPSALVAAPPARWGANDRSGGCAKHRGVSDLLFHIDGVA